MTLIADRFSVVIIGSPQRYTSGCGLKVESSAATGTIIDYKVREFGQQIVPESVQSRNIPDLTNPIAPGFIVAVPEPFRIDIVVLPVIIDPVLSYQSGHILPHPSVGILISKIDKKGILGFPVDGVRHRLATSGQEHVLRMLISPVGILHNPFRFEPYHELAASIMNSIGDFTQSGRKPVSVYFPVSDCVCPVVAVFPVCGFLVPAGIEPEDFGKQIEFFITVDKSLGIFGCQASIFIARIGISVVETAADRWLHRVSACPRIMMSEDELTENILTIHPVFSLPRNHCCQRSPDFFPRAEIRAEILESGRNTERILARTYDVGSPGTGPADCEHHPSGRGLDIEVRETAGR